MTQLINKARKDLAAAINQAVKLPHKADRKQVLMDALHYIASHLGLKITIKEKESEASNG